MITRHVATGLVPATAELPPLPPWMPTVEEEAALDRAWFDRDTDTDDEEDAA